MSRGPFQDRGFFYNAICPECGRIYVSGGTTKTLAIDEKQSGIQQQEEDKGGLIDVLV